jgi:hypothetical protein
VLGQPSITSRGTDVELAPDAPLAVDARELRAAVAAGHWGDVIHLYRGPFLDGVHPGGSARLESWIERERRELERLFLRACEREYAGLRAAARWEDAVSVARQWLAADSLSEAAALALLGALEAPDTEEAGARAPGLRGAAPAPGQDYGASPGERVQARAAVLAERLTGPGNRVADGARLRRQSAALADAAWRRRSTPARRPATSRKAGAEGSQHDGRAGDACSAAAGAVTARARGNPGRRSLAGRGSNRLTHCSAAFAVRARLSTATWARGGGPAQREPR